jgi:hypothetical protein
MHLTLPAQIYDQLQSAATEQNKSVDNLLIDILAQRFPSQKTSIEQEFKRTERHEFVTEWVLLDSSF